MADPSAATVTGQGTSTTPPATEPTDRDKIQIWKDMLYEQCQANGSESRLYSQIDLLDFDVIPRRDPATLLRVVQRLCDDRLLVPVSGRDGLAWKWRDVQEAAKYERLA
jgi:hypothetical protein